MNAVRRRNRVSPGWCFLAGISLVTIGPFVLSGLLTAGQDDLGQVLDEDVAARLPVAVAGREQPAQRLLGQHRYRHAEGR